MMLSCKVSLAMHNAFFCFPLHYFQSHISQSFLQPSQQSPKKSTTYHVLKFCDQGKSRKYQKNAGASLPLLHMYIPSSCTLLCVLHQEATQYQNKKSEEVCFVSSTFVTGLLLDKTRQQRQGVMNRIRNAASFSILKGGQCSMQKCHNGTPICMKRASIIDLAPILW